jgi:hypothetical protein
MGAHEDQFLGWRPVFDGLIDVGGYQVVRLNQKDPNWPSDIFKLEFQDMEEGYFIVASSPGPRRKYCAQGLKPAMFLEFLNISTSDNFHSLTNFFTKYGRYHGWRPWSRGEIKEYCLEIGRFMSELEQLKTEAMLGFKDRDFFKIDKAGPYIGPYIEIDLVTKQVVIKALNVMQFVRLQIAEAVSRGKAISNCTLCGAFMMPQRKTREFCSDTCRSRANRRKHSK